MEEKQIEEKINEQSDKVSVKFKDILKDLPAITSGTINTGDATTDTIIVSLIDRVNKLTDNLTKV